MINRRKLNQCITYTRSFRFLFVCGSCSSDSRTSNAYPMATWPPAAHIECMSTVFEIQLKTPDLKHNMWQIRPRVTIRVTSHHQSSRETWSASSQVHDTVTANIFITMASSNSVVGQLSLYYFRAFLSALNFSVKFIALVSFCLFWTQWNIHSVPTCPLPTDPTGVNIVTRRPKRLKFLRPQPTRRTSWKLVANPGWQPGIPNIVSN